MAEIPYRYISVDDAVETHKIIIRTTGGLTPIVVKSGSLDSVLSHMTNDDYYPDFVDKIAHLVFGLNKNHAFGDGNKRVSLALSCLFLQKNGYDNVVTQYTHGMEEVVVWVAKSLIEKNLLKNIIEFLISEDTIHVALFVQEARKYRQYIEPENSPIQSSLLNRMVEEWLSNGLELSEGTKLAILEVIDPEEFGGQH